MTRLKLNSVFKLLSTITLLTFAHIMYAQSNPYADFNPQQHYRPEINSIEFFKNTGFEFGWLLLEPISEMAGESETETIGTQRLSPGQKALYFWWYLDGQVTNGGFEQFYYNGYADYVPAIIEGLKFIGDEQVLKLVEQADSIYQRLKSQLTKDDQSFGNYYEVLAGMDELGSQYYDLNEQTMDLIEQYIRQHPEQFCVDQEGHELEADYTGMVTSYYPDQKIKGQAAIKNGRLEGKYTRYTADKQIEFEEVYANNLRMSRKEYYENGVLWAETIYDEDGEKHGVYRVWHNNGQLGREEYYEHGEHCKTLERFYENGQPKEEGKYDERGFYTPINYWKEDGTQLLKEGNGIYIHFFTQFDDEEKTVTSYHNYQRNGKQEIFINGRLDKVTHFRNDKWDGICQKYYENGRLKQEDEYKMGTKMKSQTFSKFKKPKGKVTFEFSVSERWLESLGEVVPDQNAKCVNEAEVLLLIKIPDKIIELADEELDGSVDCSLSIDREGKVNSSELDMIDLVDASDVEPYLKSLRFEPAIKDGQAVKTIVNLLITFTVIEGE